MDVVIIISQFFKFNVIAESDFLCDRANGERDIILQKSFSVFNGKDNVVVGLVCIVVCFLNGHASSLTWKPRVSKPSYMAPAASRGEIPAGIISSAGS